MSYFALHAPDALRIHSPLKLPLIYLQQDKQYIWF